MVGNYNLEFDNEIFFISGTLFGFDFENTRKFFDPLYEYIKSNKKISLDIKKIELIDSIFISNIFKLLKKFKNNDIDVVIKHSPTIDIQNKLIKDISRIFPSFTLLDHKSSEIKVNIKDTFTKIIAQPLPLTEYHTQDKETIKTIDLAFKNMRTDIPLLILGNIGAGKSTLAKCLMRLFPRKGIHHEIDVSGYKSFDHLKSDLFGVEEKTYTEVSKKEGFFKACNNGILFIDEIQGMDFECQTLLKKVVQDKTVSPMGSINPEPINTKLIFGSNRNLKELVDEGKFHPDLYSRIAPYSIYIKDLNERPGDAAYLFQKILANTLYQQGKKGLKVEMDVFDYIENLNWEYNIRSLENFCKEIVIHNDSGYLSLDDIKMTKRDIEFSSIKNNESDIIQDLFITSSSYKDFLKKIFEHILKTRVVDKNLSKRFIAKSLKMPLSSYLCKLKDLKGDF